jgi:hypothetical protein
MKRAKKVCSQATCGSRFCVLAMSQASFANLFDNGFRAL